MKTYDVTNATDADAAVALECGRQIRTAHGFALGGVLGPKFACVPHVGETTWHKTPAKAVAALRKLSAAPAAR